MLQSQHTQICIFIVLLLFLCLSVTAVPQSYGVDDLLTQTYAVDDPLAQTYGVDQPTAYATAPPTYETEAVYSVDTSLGYGPAPKDGGYGPLPTSTSTSCTSTKTTLPPSSTPTTLATSTTTLATLDSPSTSSTTVPTESSNSNTLEQERDSPSKKPGLKKGETIGIAVAAAGVLVAIIFGLATLYYQCRAAEKGIPNPITHSSPVMAVRGLFSDRAPLLGRSEISGMIEAKCQERVEQRCLGSDYFRLMF